nr:MAG TPA: hypothetical protein [Bacteriophage sp.]
MSIRHLKGAFRGGVSHSDDSIHLVKPRCVPNGTIHHICCIMETDHLSFKKYHAFLLPPVLILMGETCGFVVI